MIFRLLLFALSLLGLAYSQKRSTLAHEIGGGLGLSTYYGDLNSIPFRRPMWALEGFYRLNLPDGRWAFRVSLGAMQVEAYDSDGRTAYQKNRNLSFRSLILEMSAAVEFNFFRLDWNGEGENFTPYFSFGLAPFYFQPKAKDDAGTWVNLTDFSTEGKNYSQIALAFPLILGVKWKLSPVWLLDLSCHVRPTTTSYLDDVSGLYVLNNPSAMSDRRIVKNPNDMRRGSGNAVDLYSALMLKFSYRLQKQACACNKK